MYVYGGVVGLYKLNSTEYILVILYDIYSLFYYSVMCTMLFLFYLVGLAFYHNNYYFILFIIY